MNEEQIKKDFDIAFQNLSQWLVQTRSLFQMVRKTSYTIAETERMAKMFGCTLVRSGTKYNLVKNGKVLSNGTLPQIFDYVFENLIIADMIVKVI
ncbi:MAG: hypothetical protein WBL95_06920 [Microcoleus sp.]